MPIISFISQPATNSINAAYRPVILKVRATASNGVAKPPVVYCDIYFDSIFYKTLSKSQYTQLNSTDSDWQFDLQDACQEFMRPYLGSNGGSVIEPVTSGIVSVNCLFRSSGINSSGFIESEGTAPVQATSGIAAVSGTGTSSTTFNVVNSALQNEDSQDLATHLNSFKTGSWNSNYFPWTHRPAVYKICNGDSDFFPVVRIAGDTGGGSFRVVKLRLNYTLTGQTTLRQATSNVLPMNGKAIYIPNGPKNIAPLFPLVNMADVESYYVQGLGVSDIVLFTTPVNTISKCCAEDKIRIHFVNYLGTVDAINFALITKEHEPKSGSWERPLRYPLDKAVHGMVRFNVRSNNTFNVVSTDYNEAQMDWIEELFDSGLAWMEWAGAQGEASMYIPIVLTDKAFVSRKEDDRYTYELAVEFRLSHDKILIRN